MARKPKLPPGLWDRDGVYYARFRAGGRVIRRRLSTDLTAAKELLNDLRARADRGDFGIVDNDYPWQDLKREFLRMKRQTTRQPETYDQDLRKIEEYGRIKSAR